MKRNIIGKKNARLYFEVTMDQSGFVFRMIPSVVVSTYPTYDHKNKQMYNAVQITVGFLTAAIIGVLYFKKKEVKNAR